MRTKFTFKTHTLFAAAALLATLLAGRVANAQAQFIAGKTYYVDGVGKDLVAPKDTFISLGGKTIVYNGGAYTDTTGIFPALNVNGIDSNTLGQITILLVPGYTGVETLFPTLKGVPFASPNRPIVLKPFGTYTITRTTFSGSEAVIRLEGAQYFTIDGESTPGQRDLTFIPPPGASAGGVANNHKVIDIVTHPNNPAIAISANNTITIKNVNIRGLLVGNTSITQAGVFGGGSSGFAFSGYRRAENISIINCNIQNVQQGVYIKGLANGASSHDHGLVIKNNIIGGEVGSFIGTGAPNLAAIAISNQANVLIEGNTISGNLSPNASHFSGIFVTSIGTNNVSSLDSAVTINANKIYNLRSNANASAVYGIRFYHTNGTNNPATAWYRNQNMGYKVTNNVISNISSFGTTNNYTGNPVVMNPPYPVTTSTAVFPVGIAIEEYSANASVDIYNNSISMGDETLKGSSAACIYVGLNTNGGIRLVNNVLSNRMRNFPNDEGAYQVVGVLVNSAVEPFDVIDNNVYDISTTGGWAYIGRNISRTYSSLDEWRNYTRDDANSLTVKAIFDDPITLSTLNGAATTYGTLGRALVGTDVTGAARPSLNHSIGAYQFTQDPSLAPVPLVGGKTYMINGVTSIPTANSNSEGSFKNLADFVGHLNTYGTTGNDTIKVIFDNGYNTGLGDAPAVIPAVIPYPGMASTRKIVLSTAPGVSVVVKLGDTLRIPGNSGIFRLSGVSDFNINGKGPNGERTITFSMSDSSRSTTAKVISMTPTYLNRVGYNTITYCNIHGNAVMYSASPALIMNVNTAAGIYIGDPFAPSGLGNSLNNATNLSNSITYNFIGGVRSGIYWAAKDSITDQLNTIKNNTIGGAMSVPGGRGRVFLLGGAANQSGIYIKGLATSIIDSNVVCNSHPVFSGFSGIFLNGSPTIGRSFDLVVSKNTIYNLGCTAGSGGFAVGIRIALNEKNRSIRIQNNFITKIYGAGGNLNNMETVSAPAGIAIDPIPTTIAPVGTSTIDLGINISHNTINLPKVPGVEVGNNLYTSAFFVGSRVGGLRVMNNIFANTSGRNSTYGNNAIVASVVFGGTRLTATDAFSRIDGNVYYAYNRYCLSYVGLARNNPTSTILYTINELKLYAGFDALSFYGEVPFLNDTTIQMDPYYIGHIVNNKDIFTEQTVDEDITGASRPAGVNNTSVGALHIPPTYDWLVGGQNYQVTGVMAPPTMGQQTGQFNTINNLFRYISTNGVDSKQPFPVLDITVEITPGYAGEGDTLISPLMKYPLMGPGRKIIIKPVAGATPVIASTGATTVFDGTSSVIRLQGAKNIIIDGSNNGTNSRDLTIRMPIQTGGNLTNIQSQAARVIDVIGWESPAEDNMIKNCNIIGHSTNLAINTYSGIYQGGVNFGQASNNVPTNSFRSNNNRNEYRNNYITAVKHGIQLRGGITVTSADRDVVIAQNVIGGNTNVGGATATDYFGGGLIVSTSPLATNIYASAIAAFTQINLTIDSNVIQNSLKTMPATNPVLGNAGIEIGWLSSKVKVSRNIINNIRTENNASPATSSGSYGIYVNVPWNEKRSINIENNMISRVVSSVNNTYGIFLNGSTNTTDDIDVNIYNNSINLSNLDTTNGVAACIGNGANARGAIRIENNILQNNIVRKTGGTANYIFHSAYTLGNTYETVDNNNYYVNSPNALNNMALMGTTTITSFANWVNYTKQDTLSMNYPAPYTSESNLFIPAGTASPLYMGGRRVPTILTDLAGTVRPTSGESATIGAHEFNGTFADSAAPKMYDYTPIPDYCSFAFQPILINARILDRNPMINDTLYYTLNGALPELFVTPSITNGFQRTYEIPGQPDNTMIAYRLASVDGSLKPGTFVNGDRVTGLNYTTTMMSTFPITIGFDEPNVYGFRTQQISGTAGWNLESFGSQTNPFLFPKTGAKAALLPAVAGSASRILTPCLDFTQGNMNLPIIRLYVSQNSDAPNLNDSIVIRKWFGSFSQTIDLGPFNPIRRVNPNPGATPAYKVYDICLKELSGASGFKLSIEGFSKGGSNILIDSIIIMDNFVDHDVTVAPVSSCFNDSFAIDISNTSPQNEYYLYDVHTGAIVSQRVVGNGGILTLKGYMPTVDSAEIKAMYTNLTALGCEVDPSQLTKSTKVYFGTFRNGPFVKRGDSFYGMFNDGTQPNPDAVRVGGTADFEIVGPGNRPNADYGTSWTIAGAELRNVSTDQLNTTSLSIVPATAGTPAFVKVTGVPADSNKLFRLSVVLRLLPQGCDSVLVRYVRVANAPQVNFFAFNDTLCQGQGILFRNITSNGVFTLPVTYKWDFGDGDTSEGITPVKKFTTPGTYNVKLIATNTSTLMDSVTVTYVVNPSPTASYTHTTPCHLQPVAFTNTSTMGPGITYEWNVAGQITTDTNVLTVIPYSDTIVMVSLLVRNEEGCTDTASAPTAVFAQPVANFTANNVCAGASVFFNNASTIAPGKENRKNEIGYEWDFGNGEIGYSEDPLYKYPAGGTYNVTLKVISNFGCTDTATATVSVFDKPVSVFDIDNTCKASNVIIANNSTYSGGLDKVNYKWDFGDNSPQSTDAVPVKQYGEARFFYISLVVTDTVNFCSDSSWKLISVKESAKAEFTAENGCVNTPVQFTNVSVVPSGVTPVYGWTFGDGGTSANASTSHTYTTGGDKYVAFKVDIDGCVSMAYDTISISNAPTISFTASTDADSIKYTFVASSKAFSQYRWDFGDLTIITNGAGKDSAENIYARAGRYTVVLTATDENGCVATATDDTSVVVSQTVGIKDNAIAAKYKFNVYPNPFATSAKVSFEMDSRKEVSLEVYDVLGRKVLSRNEGELSAGKHEIEFNENGFISTAGAYLVRVKIGDEVITRQLIKQ